MLLYDHPVKAVATWGGGGDGEPRFSGTGNRRPGMKETTLFRCICCGKLSADRMHWEFMDIAEAKPVDTICAYCSEKKFPGFYK